MYLGHADKNSQALLLETHVLSTRFEWDYSFSSFGDYISTSAKKTYDTPSTMHELNKAVIRTRLNQMGAN